MQLTQKETELLKDLKDQEDVCVQKYNRYAGEAHDGQLKQMFTEIAKQEQQHLDTVNAMLDGVEPTLPQNSSSSTSNKFTQTYTMLTNDQNAKMDCFLCSDLLATEKHVSSLYDTCVFEFAQPKLREVLNHIQKEEQHHGKLIYDYMAANAMYS